jgi:hypothetical protein
MNEVENGEENWGDETPLCLVAIIPHHMPNRRLLCRWMCDGIIKGTPKGEERRGRG